MASESRAFRASRGQRYENLKLIDAATALAELQAVPGNRLELLRGNRARQHSIRINQQWRICFVWAESSANQVEIVDYH
jgi:toxin HigB-1